MKVVNIAICFVIVSLLWCLFNGPSHAEDYEYQGADATESHLLERSADTDEDKEVILLERKKGKKKQKGSEPAVNPGTQNSTLPPPPPCEVPLCTVQDPILPDEVCNNDCRNGSGWHCQGRHDWTTHRLYAICVPD